MRRLRSLSTRRLLASIAAAVATLAAGTTIAIAATSGGAKPAPSALDSAVQRALSAKPVAGVTARIAFTNELIGGASAAGADPLLAGAHGRLWAAADGRMRIELQADQGGTGDAQITWDGTRLSVFEPGANTVYRFTPAQDPAASSTPRTPPSLGDIDRVLARLGEHSELSGAQPANVAGRPAYSVRVTPKDRGSRVDGAALAWDAATGVPLRLGVYAQGRSAPVLELSATDISYGSVSDSDLATAVPAGAKLVDLSPGPDHGGRDEVTGLAAVQRAVGFRIAAPDTLGGAARTQTRLIASGRDAGALTTYGTGLGTIAVLQTPAKPGERAIGGGRDGLSLPSVDVGGASGQQLDTPLGSIVRFTRDGVDYVVAGSVPAATVLAAARGL